MVGAGTAGLIGAQTAAALGARVLLVERAPFGGDCLWTGRVPSEALLAAAHAAAGARQAARLGVHVDEVRVDVPGVLAHVRRAIATIEPVDSPDAVRRSGASVTTGDVRFTGATTAEIDGRPVTFRQALVATGSAPAIPDLPGLGNVDALTTDSLWELTDLPPTLTVLGGGTSGCELAQALARLGVQVTVVEAGERLLASEDPDASAAVTDALQRDGVRILLRADAARGAVRPAAGRHRAQPPDGGPRAGRGRRGGRRPRPRGRGHRAAHDEPRIWAAGDVTGHPQLTHVAGVHGSLPALNAVLGLRRTVDLSAVPG